MSTRAGVSVNLALATKQNTGGAGFDTLVAFENLTGSAFDDTLEGTKGNNILDGGSGDNTVSYAHATAGVKVDLGHTGQQNTVGAGFDTLSNFDNVIGSKFNDTFTSNGNANVFDGGAGVDTVSYAVSAAGVTVSLAANTATGGDAAGDTFVSIENLTGSAFDDTFEGTSGTNVLAGGVGTDTVSYEHASATGVLGQTGVTINLALTTAQNTVSAGTDTLSGFENIIGSAFNDTLTGTSGSNEIDGGNGIDTVSYAASKAGVNISLAANTAAGGDAAGDVLTNIENLTGSALADTLEGDDGNNVLNAGAGIDTASYEHAGAGVTVTLAAATQQDTVGAGLDTLVAFENLTGSAFDDTLTGNTAANVLAGLDGADAIDGGAGVDTVSYAASGAGVTVSLAANTAAGGDAAGDVLTNIENLTGSSFDDMLEGTSGSNVLAGGVGTDTVSYATATAGVTVNLSVTTAQNTLGAGTDTLSGFENIIGSGFNDTLTGTSGANAIDGGNGVDTVSYAASKVGVNISLAAGTASGGDATGDTLTSIENLTGSAQADTLEGDDNDNVLNGGAGVDTVSYATAIAGVTVSLSVTKAQNTGGAGSDTLVAFENLTGSSHDDTLTGNTAANILAGLGGADAIDGGAGVDTVSYAASNAGVTIGLDGAAGIGGDAEGDTLINIENITGSDLDDVISGNKGANVLVGGLGTDTVSYATATAGVTVNLSLATAQNTVGAGTDTLSGFENVIGSNFKDIFTGTSGDNVFDGGGSVDTVSYANATSGVTVDLLEAGAQNTGGSGNDTLTDIENLTGSNFNDTLAGNDGDNILNGGAGIDTLTYANASAGVNVSLSVVTAQNTGGAGTDTVTAFENLTGSDFDDTLEGTKGNNVLDGGLGNNTVSYAHATAGVKVDLGNTGQQNTVGAGLDTLSNFDNIIGSGFNDTFTASAAANTFNGGNGLDTVSYAASAAGVQVLLTEANGTGGDASGDTYTAIENVTGSAGDDIIGGNAGNNVLIGGGGNDTVTYEAATSGVTVNLGLATAQNTVGAGTDTLSGFQNIIGSDFNDTLTGNTLANVFDGGDGSDTVSYAGSKAAVSVSLDGGAISGGDATGDTLTDIENLTGSAFNDVIEGSAGDNVLVGGAGIDTLTFENATSGVAVSLALTTAQNTNYGTDKISGFENLTGSSQDDILEGDKGNNHLDGGTGNDTVSYAHATAGVTVDLSKTTAQNTVGAGADTLTGFENLTGSNFNDTLSGDANDNVLDGGAGTSDTLTYADAGAGVTVSLAVAGPQATGGAGTDEISNFENLTGSAFDDVLEGNDGANALTGGAGIDTVSYANAGAGVTINLALTTAQNTIGAGSDKLSGFENVTGSAFDDTIQGDKNNNTLDGGAGTGDTVSYAAATAGVIVSLAAGSATGFGTDTLSNFENVTGSNFNDTIEGDDGDNVLAGGAGTDTLSYASAAAAVTVSLATTTVQATGGAGSDTISGFENLTGSAHDDILTGNSGANQLSGDAGSDRLDGGTGADVLTGGADADTYVYADGYGADKIADFSQTDGDKIDVSGVTGIFSFADVLSKAAQSGANTVITFGTGNTLTLVGVDKNDLSAADFVFPQSIDGTAGDDNGIANPAITGTASSDIINGLTGNDVIAGLGGNDFIDGGAGRDFAIYTDAASGISVDMAKGTVTGGGTGTDTLRGIEYVRGSDFNDTYVATGFDRNSPNNAQDFELQTSLNNGFEGGGGNDTITGNGATQVFYTHAAAGVTVDLLAGTAKSTVGDDAGIGNDKFTITGGVATVTGVAGSAFDDTFFGTNNSVYVDVFFGGAGNDFIDGRGGYDVVLYYSFVNKDAITGGINVDLAAGTVTGDASVGTDTLKSIEIIRGTQYADTYDATGFNGTSTNAGSFGAFNSFEGMEGDDIITGNGSTRVDYNYALASVTVDIQAGTGHSTNADDAAVGVDTFTGVNQARGSSYDDFLYGSANNDSFFGGAGDDALDGRGGIDSVLYYQGSNDPVTAGVSIDMASGIVTGKDASVGTDTLRSIEVVNGSQFADVYDATGFGAASANAGSGGLFNQFQGMGGNDLITGNGQTRVGYFNALAGVTVDLAAGTAKSTAAGDAAGVGVDTITKGTVNSVAGSNFADILSGSNNANGTVEVFEGRGGNDTIDGKGGFDLVTYSPDVGTTSISVTASSTAFTVTGAGYGTDTLKAIESIRGTNFADTYNATGYNGASIGPGVTANFNEFQGGAGNDTVIGNGNTRLIYIDATAGVIVDLAAGSSRSILFDNAFVGVDTISGVNAVRGSNFGDLIVGNNGANILDGNFGNDTIDGGAGSDTLIGGVGTDTYVYKDGYGADVVNDFNRVEGDVIDVTGVSGIFSLSDILSRATQVGPSTVITFGAGNTLTLNNVLKTDLVTSDFTFLNTIDGTAGDDNGAVLPVIQGTSAVEQIRGLAGNDVIEGLGGNDLIDGGTGRDVADYHAAGAGITVNLASGSVHGDASVGTDTLRSVEYVRGTDFNDTFVATGFGPNSANDSKDIDVISSINNGFEGGGGNDTITGNGATQILYTHAAAAVTVDLLAGTGKSTVNDDAGVGNDTFTITSGVATVTGIAGSAYDDTLLGTNNAVYVDAFYGGAGDDTIDGRGGYDVVVYYPSLNRDAITAGITVDLGLGTVTGDASVGTDTLRSIELIRGTKFADTYDASGFSGASANAGSAGTFNSFEGMEGDDHVIGNGATRIDYNFASASVTVDIQVGTGHSTVGDDANVGNDTFTGVNNVRGSGFDDFLSGSTNFDTFFGGAGDDVIDGRSNFDRVQYNQSANDPVTAGVTVNMSAGTVVGDVSVGTDTLLSIESVMGSRFADVYNATNFRSDAGANKGSAGVDGTGAAFNEFQGLSGNDIVTGNGNTRIAFYNALDGVTVVLGNNGSSKGTAAGDVAGVGTDTLVSGVNSVVGSNFADNFTGTNNVPGTSEIFEGRGGSDIINGKGGYDLAVYNNDGASGPITVTATSSTLIVTGVNVGTDTLTAVESIRGTNLADTFDATGFKGASTDISYGSMSNFNEFEGLAGNDVITGNGNTRLVYSSASAAVTVDLIAGTATGNGSVGTDTFTGVNSVRGSNFNDVIFGTDIVDFVDTFFGGAGNDTIDGRGGYDIAFYTDANGAIAVDMAAGTVTGNGSVGIDTLNAIELIRGTRFADTYDATGFSGISTNAGSFDTFNVFEGMGGNDTITGNGNTRVDYTQALAGVTADIGLGTGHSTAASDAAGVGIDTFTGGVNALRGSAFNDILNGSNNATGFENFTGEAGNDLIDGKGGLDRAMYSGTANDNVTGGLTINMAAGTVTGDASVGVDTLRSVEVIRASNHNDTYNATSFSSSSTNAGSNGTFNEFEGLGGNDTITGNGNTRIAFYSAQDGVTVDLVSGKSQSTNGGDSAHVGIDSFTGVNAVRGSAFGDHLIGKSGTVTLDGQGADDTLVAGGGANTLIGGAGNDLFVFSTTKASNAIVSDFAGAGAAAGDHFEFDGFGTAAQGATFTFLSSSGGDSTWQIHSGVDAHNELITLKGITSAAGVHASDYLFV